MVAPLSLSNASSSPPTRLTGTKRSTSRNEQRCTPIDRPSSTQNQGDPRDFGGLKEGDSVIVDVKESPPKFKVRHQAVRVELGDYDAAQRDIPSVSAGSDGPNKAENEILNQVGTVAVVEEDGGILTFGAENEARAIFDRQKLGFNARLTNNRRRYGAVAGHFDHHCAARKHKPSHRLRPGAKTFNAPRSPAQLSRQVLFVVSPGATQGLVPDTCSVAATASAPTGTPSNTGNGASAVPPGPQWSAECGAHSTANYAHPVPPKKPSPALFHQRRALEHQGPRQRNAENGASVSVRTRPQQTAVFPAPFPASNHSVTRQG
ncbi:hypothetical protein MRX96_049623 [Rhipicephalus microplus]